MTDPVTARTEELVHHTTFHWILRLGLACCFIGHGALGVLKVAAWASYFAVVGIGPDRALALMPWVGVFDITLGVIVLFSPLRSFVFYMTVWTIWTAVLRPLAGESSWEAVERAGNYGVPLALFLLLSTEGSLTTWLRGRCGPAWRGLVLHWTLRLTTVSLLFGHGMLNWIVQKPMFLKHYDVLGLPGLVTEHAVGVFECLLALAVLFKPDHRLLIGVVVWKIATEMLNPMAGSPFWVFIEHGGSYAAPLALAFLVARSRVAARAGAALTT